MTSDLSGILAHFEEHGYARLGPVMGDGQLETLRARADEIMLGKVSLPGFFFQLDTESGVYRDLVFGRGYEGPSLNYRKIEKLEKDDLFRAWIENPLFERVSRALITGPIAIYRAVLMNKPAAGGTVLPWHQDGGLFWGLDRDPVLQVGVADVGRSFGLQDQKVARQRVGFARNDLERDFPSGKPMFGCPHFGPVPHAQGTGQLVPMVDDIADPVHPKG